MTIQLAPRIEAHESRVFETWFSPAQVVDLIPGISTNLLAQWRFHGKGPRYSKPSPRKVVYSASAIDEFLRSMERDSTAEAS